MKKYDEKIFEYSRNILMVNSAGDIVWQVQTASDKAGGPFTNIFFDEDDLMGYRWDGGLYKINLIDGKGLPYLLMK